MKLIILLTIFTTVSSFNYDIPCTILKETAMIPKPYPYIIRNHSTFNKKFNELLTPEALMKALKNATILTYQPYNKPTDLKREKFGPMFQDHFLKYENMSMEEILAQRPRDTRMISTLFNRTHDIIPDHILKHHDCSFLGGPHAQQKDFFLSAKGQGTNFHMHGKIWTQTVFGSKLWLFAKDKEVLEQIGMSAEQTPAQHIYRLISTRTVNMCIANKNDIVYVPQAQAHATFNLQNTFAASCISTGLNSEEEMAAAMQKQGFISDKPSTEVCTQPKKKKEEMGHFIKHFQKIKDGTLGKEPTMLPMKPGKLIRDANNTKVSVKLTNDGWSDLIPCNFPEFDKPILYHEPYILRNSTIHKQFNEVYTIENLKEALGDTYIMSMAPVWRPEQYDKVKFSSFIDKHLLKYDNMSLYHLIKKQKLDIRMPFMRYNTTHPVPPKYMQDLHNCSFAREVAPGNLTTWDYFLSAKGQSVNFHKHNAIFTAVTKGKKLWLLPEHEEVLEELHISKQKTPASYIEKLINHPRVKTCIEEAGDIVYIPPKQLHGIFNLETTLAHGCIVFDSKKQYAEQMKFNRHANIWDL